MRKMLEQNPAGSIYNTDSQRQVVEKHRDPFLHSGQNNQAEQEQQQQ